MTDEKRDLPVTPGQAYEDDASPASGRPPGDGPGPEPADEVPSWRLVSTLAVAGALAGLLIVAIFQWAQPQILEHRARVLNDAIHVVLGGAERHETLFVEGDGLVREPPAGTDTLQADKVYLGYDEGGEPIGFAVVGEKPGFQDVVQLIFGYDPGTDQILGMQVLESKETPGLGDKIFKDTSFVAGFAGAEAPITGVKAGAGTGSPDEVDMITGATISSRTVIDIINARIEELDPLLKRYMDGAGTGGQS
jgi:electron transport complex protein RnfG